jgi:regulator of protease activity HflC (stomatin/prohibitin superfamily)
MPPPRPPPEFNVPIGLITVVLAALLVIWLASKCVQTIDPGHVGVGALFGSVQDEALDEGFHLVNPLVKWTQYDCRKKTHSEQDVGIPSRDQLVTSIDISVQFRINRDLAPLMLQETGTANVAINVHLIPKLRSLSIELGKAIERAEDFFMDETQRMMQDRLKEGLVDFCEPKGISVHDVLINDIRLPPFILRAIEGKKEREQEVEKQKAELERFRTEQQQKIAQAQAERAAAEEEAAQRRILADARSYEIRQINEAVSSNPAYIKLQALEALRAISENPSSKIYFLNGDSPDPLPLMHIGDPSVIPVK